VDAGRQLEVLAQLFREKRMPENGVDILQEVASGSPQEEIAQDLEVTVDTVDGRMRMMRDRFRRRTAKLRMLPDLLPLEVIVSNPSATDTLRKAA
jgi:FixJ family two-component response regulator